MSLFHEEMDLYMNQECSLEQQIELWMERQEYNYRDIPKSFLPKFYQCLPRQKERPTSYREEFSDREVIKKLLLQKMNLYFFPKQSWALKKKITLFTYVMEDGMGDLIASNQIKYILQKEGFTSVMQVLMLPEKYRGLSLCVDRSYCHYFSENDDLHFSHFSSEIQNSISDCDMLWQVPTFYPFWDELVKKVKPKSFFTLAEYGFINSSWATPKNEKTLSMGLHFLEIGILIKNDEEQVKECPAIEEKIAPLLTWEQFLSHSDFIFAYIKDVSGLFVFLSIALKKYTSSPKNLVIALTDASLFLQLMRDGKISLEKHHIKELRVRLKDAKYRIPISSEGKCLEIVELGSLTPAEVSFLYQSSKALCACRGNQGFSEVVSLNALYFYDPAPHAQPFLMDLYAVASKRIEAFPSAVEYIRGFLELHHLKTKKEDLTPLARKMADLFCLDATAKGILLLSEILQNEFNASAVIPKIVLKELSNHHNLNSEESSAANKSLM